jgi:glycosyltransferase involved in cell wall biosynthesis
MSVKTFGIYIAFAPGVDLRHEGLGRYLAALLQGVAQREDRRFVLLCPSWSQQDLHRLFISEGVVPDSFEILAPSKVPILLRLRDTYNAWRMRPARPGAINWLKGRIGALRLRLQEHLEHRLVGVQSGFALLTLLPEVLLALAVMVLLSPLLLLVAIAWLLRGAGKRLLRHLRPLWLLLRRFNGVLASPKDDAFALRLFRRLEQVETERMHALLEDRQDILAWYCPTAFWPAFNTLKAPRLMCVPDVVLSDFPVGFAQVGGDRFLQVFDRVERAIRSGEHFVTYSEAVKRSTLEARYGVHQSCVTVIQHAPNDLGRWVRIEGSEQADEVSRNYCRALLMRAFQKATSYAYMRGFDNAEVRFIFYASQFRPNKNVISLLKAYEYLLRNRYVGHKLVLTGHPDVYPVVRQFIEQHALDRDVICLPGLSVQELAACYKLADLAVNPSKSEGGFPFTFSEALSVGTPVLMARIDVTDEVLDDPDLRALTLFDADDWRQMADRIEWALLNLDVLHAAQKPLYERLAARTWADVANEHIAVLERICQLEKHQGLP